MMNLDVTADVTIPQLTGSAAVRSWMATIALALVVFASLANAITTTGAIVADDASATPKAYHALLITVGALLLLRGRIPRLRRELIAYFAITITTTAFAYVAYEPRVAGIKLLIALYVAVVATAVGRTVGHDVAIRACRFASVAFLLVVTAKNAMHAPAFLVYLANPFGHPDIPSLAGGGLNLEATWLALSSVFMIGTAWFVPFTLAAAATSALYASRAGVVVAGLAVAVALLRAWTSRPNEAVTVEAPISRRSRRRLIIAPILAIGAMAGLTVGFRWVRTYGDATYVAERFATIGEEPGSLGRATLWRGGLRVFAENPLGVGSGNAVPALRRTLGVDVPEDNLHNVYLQQMVECGIPGLVALIAFGWATARRLVRDGFRDPLLLFVGGYLIAGAIQFTGVDAMLWLVYGLQSGATADAGGNSA